MRIIADDNIPFLKGALEKVAEVIYLPGGKTDKIDLIEADAVITRTRTKCNKSTLSGTKVKFIATATIGFDHIDTAYCDSAGIKWTNAPGCNSESVKQYLVRSLIYLADQNNWNLSEKTLGIIGAGNVGSKVAKAAEILGMKVLINDPPRKVKEGLNYFVELEQIQAESDIISLHVPLNRSGKNKTIQLVDRNFINKCVKKPVIINSSRGKVVKQGDLKEALINKKLEGAILDVWENEPNLDLELLDLVKLATPHIAGYSKDGKANGTSMSVQALSRFFNLGLDNWKPDNIPLPENSQIIIEGKNKSDQEILSEAIRPTYDIEVEDQKLRTSPDTFEKQRGNYPVRREFHAYSVKLSNSKKVVVDKLTGLGFQVEV